VISPRVLSPQASRDDLPVVVREVREAAEARDVARAINVRMSLERQGVDLQPSTLGLREP